MSTPTHAPHLPPRCRPPPRRPPLDLPHRPRIATSSAPDPGALVTITDSREIPLGTALYSSASTIAARLVSRTPALTRAQYLADLRTRIDAALQLRRELAPTSATNNAHRLIFSEADNLPGIIADRYNDLVLLQLLTQGTAQDDVRAVLVAAFAHAFAKEKCALTLWERPDPRIRELEQLPAPATGPLFTTHTDSIAPDGLSFRTEAQRDADQAAPTTTLFSLNGLSFHYDAASGQKTGAFLDQRLNYAAATRAVKSSGRTQRALDICTYQGGFALHLAQVCSHVTGVDASRAALEAADRNLALNSELAARCEVEWIEADAFDYLRDFDDPPQDLLARPTSSTPSSSTLPPSPNPNAPPKAPSAATRNSTSAPSACSPPAAPSSPTPAPTTSRCRSSPRSSPPPQPTPTAASNSSKPTPPPPTTPK